MPPLARRRAQPARGLDPLVLAVAAAGLVAVGAGLVGELRMLGGRLGFPLDDSWIHLTFARRLAAGDGLAYRPGDWVTGSTSPLWTALLAVGAWTPGAAVLWAKLCGVAAYVATILTTAGLAGEMGLGRGGRLLAAALAATTSWLAWSALSGMEVLLFAALAQHGLVLHVRERRAWSDERRPPPASLAVAAAATLARPEGALLLLLAAVDRAVAFGADSVGRYRVAWRRGALAEGLAVAGVVLAPTLLFYRLAGGSVLPTTFAVKAGGGRDLLPSPRYLAAAAGIVVESQPLVAVFAGAGVLLVLVRLGGRRDTGFAVALWPFALVLAYAALSPDRGPLLLGNFGRYLFPLLPTLAVLTAVALAVIARRVRRPLAALAAAAILLPQAAATARGVDRYLQTVGNVEESDVRAALWLDGRLPEDAVLAAQDVGAVGFHLPNPLLDLAGIVAPEVATLLHHGEGYWEERLLAHLRRERPDYLLVFPGSYPLLTSRVPGMTPLARFPVRANVAMAGDELVLFATPWNDRPLREDAPGGPPR